MNEEKSLISIILPCYNVDKYIEKAINSILNQSYKNIEIIAVDDFSSDDTYILLQTLQKNNKDKIKVFRNSENKGAACARNLAIKKAAGTYIGFLDPDDMIDIEFYETLIRRIKDADICVCDIQLVDEEYQKLGVVNCCCKGEVSKFNLINNGLAASPCNKLFKAEIIKKYLFLEGKINEDVAAVIPCLANANKVAYTNEVKYYYMQRASSTQNSKFSERRFEIFDAVSVCFDRIRTCKEFEEYRQAIIAQQIILLYMLVILELSNSLERKKYIKMFIQKTKDMDIYMNKYLKYILMEHKGIKRTFYYLCIKLLRFKSYNLIEVIIKIKRCVSILNTKIKKKLK